MVAFRFNGRMAGFAALAAAGLAGCTSSGTGTPAAGGGLRELAPSLFTWGASTSVQPDVPVNEDFTCPSITVSEGGSAMRQGGDGDSVRLQLSLGQIARECSEVGMDGSFTLKVGVEGRALLGPAGRPGTFNVPIRISVNSEDKPFMSRSLRTSVTVPGGADSAQFIVVESGIRVPGGKPDLEITVGLGGGSPEPRARRRR